MKILHNISSIDIKYGGPLFSMKIVAEEQSKLGHDVFIIAGRSFDETNQLSFDDRIKVIIKNCITKFRYIPNWENHIKKEIGTPDIIHTYGIWDYPNYIANKYSIKNNVKHIIAPCGMLHKEALISSFIKKKVAWYLFQKKILLNSACIHIKSNHELKNILKFFPKEKTVLISNPINIKNIKQKSLPKQNLFKNISLKKKIIFYIGRIHEQKGLIVLLRVWNDIAINFPDWILIIAGPDNNGYKNKLINYIASSKNLNCVCVDNEIVDFNDNINLIMTGPLYGDDKHNLFQYSSLFISPSDFESFGVTITEAFAYNLPVIISKNTPWNLIEKEKCGWIINDKRTNLKKILLKAFSLDIKVLKLMGKNSKKIIQNYETEVIANKTLTLYKKLINNESFNHS